MRVKIQEIELNFSNMCTANCAMCSKPHGWPLNTPRYGENMFMEPEMFLTVLDRLKQVDFRDIQTSGNGDALLNKHYFQYLRALRKAFPHARIHFYSSFMNLNEECSRRFIDEDLIDFIFTRMDTLDPYIYGKFNNLALDTVLDNLYVFMVLNRRIEMHIGYSSIINYWRMCRDVLGKDPLYWSFTKADMAAIQPDEFGSIQKWLAEIPTKVKPKVYRIQQSLWAERNQAGIDRETPCPKRKIMENIIWINPNGKVPICGYDDEQCRLLTGDIMKQTIPEIWNSPTRKRLLDDIKNKRILTYPCNAAKCCVMRPQKYV